MRHMQLLKMGWLQIQTAVTEVCRVLAISASLVDMEATVSPEISASAVKAGTSHWGGGGRAGAGGGVSGKAYGSGGGGAYDAGYSGTSMTGGKGAAGIVLSRSLHNECVICSY